MANKKNKVKFGLQNVFLHMESQSICRVPYRFLLMQTARPKIFMRITVYIT